ncbi:MAG: hypothetical protein P8Y72_15155, partial [Anaerolineales bacterium]
ILIKRCFVCMVWFSFLDFLYERLTIGVSASPSSTDWDLVRNAPTLVLGAQPSISSAANIARAINNWFVFIIYISLVNIKHPEC